MLRPKTLFLLGWAPHLFPVVHAQYGYGPIGSASTSDALAGAGFIFEYSAIGIALETFFLGVFAVLVVFSTFIILRRDWKSRANLAMLVTTLVMFAASVSYWAISLTILVRGFHDILINNDGLSIDDRLTAANVNVSRLYLAEVYLPMVNYILGDSVVVWRAWVLWPRGNRWRWFFLPVFFLVSSVALTLLVGAWKVKAFYADTDALEWDLSYTQIASWSLSLATNVIATLLISWRAWKQRQSLREYVGRSQSSSRVSKILALLVESGFMYCLTQIALVVSWFILLPNTTAWASDLFGATAVQLSGIYPTVVIVLVSLQKSLEEATHPNMAISPSAKDLEIQGIGTHVSFAAAPQLSSSYSVSGVRNGDAHSSATEIEEWNKNTGA